MDFFGFVPIFVSKDSPKNTKTSTFLLVLGLIVMIAFNVVLNVFQSSFREFLKLPPQGLPQGFQAYDLISFVARLGLLISMIAVGFRMALKIFEI